MSTGNCERLCSCPHSRTGRDDVVYEQERLINGSGPTKRILQIDGTLRAIESSLISTSTSRDESVGVRHAYMVEQLMEYANATRAVICG